ncbi:sigma-70 family RNA polymerase sigma factor [Streptomyces sp. TRM 70361]|uniref:sigma-70 family RNA polymerase sigma factor n=1 Tax=Streptomyces sp. TRM 70361 TaxID=3116553 RepID=UPI002E7BBCBA|nr:sigma-70 family RNA polymerase sigma factor [Streptomyces sp. TRM 70361]MEE1939099.1 sigma-70 family RNA polymerase sigma factor [Streptomyces sp. TRM 70361]
MWLRWLEHGRTAGAPPHPARWLRTAVRAEVRAVRRRVRRETAYDPVTDSPADGGVHGAGSTGAGGPEDRLLRAERLRSLRTAIGRLPGRCPELLTALLSYRNPTYREVARELGISQGSLGPTRSRCVGCLRTMLTTEVALPEVRGKVR